MASVSAAPPHHLVNAYLILVSLALGGGLGALMWSTLSLVMRGEGYISHMQMQLMREGSGGSSGGKQPQLTFAAAKANLDKVFGGKGVLQWLKPIWGPAPGTCCGAGGQEKKLQ